QSRQRGVETTPARSFAARPASEATKIPASRSARGERRARRAGRGGKARVPSPRLRWYRGKTVETTATHPGPLLGLRAFVAAIEPLERPGAMAPARSSPHECPFDDELGRLAIGALGQAHLFQQRLGVLQHRGRAADHAAVGL